MYETCVMWYFQLDNGDPQGQYIQDEEPSLTNCISGHCQNWKDSTDVCTYCSYRAESVWRAALIYMNLKPLFISTSLPPCMYVVAKYFIFHLFICCLSLHTHCTALVVHHSDFWPGQQGKGITNISHCTSLPSTLITPLHWVQWEVASSVQHHLGTLLWWWHFLEERGLLCV